MTSGSDAPGSGSPKPPTTGVTAKTAGSKGNDPERWDKLLEIVDERLQFGLLERLRRVAGYHLEQDTLFIEARDAEEEALLLKDSVLQQLQLFVQDVFKVERVKIKRREP